MTSTLQMEAARKLGFAASRTMQAAQRLYEGVDIDGERVGLITYMRTDGVQMDESAYTQLRRLLQTDFGDKYLPDGPRRFATKAKNAQEAHEAIRPTDAFRRPDKLRLEGDMQRLYELIWKRTVASQMEAALLEKTSIDFVDANGPTQLRATGQVVLFDGYRAIYEEGRDDEADEDSRRLPKLAKGAKVAVKDAKSEQHFTQPPPRFSEATLVKKLEELGIGRPSTYAAILEKLRERDYVRMDKNRFIPEDRGRLVTAFLENFFRKYVEYDFTAALEEKLDLVSSGDLPWKQLMRDFWADFSKAIGDIGELRITHVLDALNESLGPHIFPPREDGTEPRSCPTCKTGTLSLRLGRYGAFIGCSNHPECKYTRPLGGEAEGAAADKELGLDPVTGMAVSLKNGRFGPYVELATDDKPKRSSLPKTWPPDSIDLDRALKLLNLPREVGKHPDDEIMVLAGLGRYGPYIQRGSTYVNLPGIDDVFEIGLNRAVALFAEKAAGGGKGRFQRGQQAALAELGESPVTNKPVSVRNGRFGPFITDGVTIVNVPRGSEPTSVTLDQALGLLAEKAAKGGGSAKKKPAAKTTAKPAAEKADKPEKKPAAKKTAAKKTPAKKPAAKKA
jgi:DNA topoisomerase-1